LNLKSNQITGTSGKLFYVFMYYCYGAPYSVADPGCFIPDPMIAPSRIQIPDPGGKKAPDPGSDLFLYKGY
jgi:hypothetical protein